MGLFCCVLCQGEHACVIPARDSDLDLLLALPGLDNSAVLLLSVVLVSGLNSDLLGRRAGVCAEVPG